MMRSLVRAGVFASIVGVAVLALLLQRAAPSEYDAHEAQHLAQYRALSSASAPGGSGDNINNGSATLGVMSFNVRLDALESDPANHFTRRVHRLRETIRKWAPAVVGVQEPFAPQMHHMLSEINGRGRRDASADDDAGAQYRAVGRGSPVSADAPDDLLAPGRHDDMHDAILYRPDLLELVELDYLWLSSRPRVPGSHDWKSMGVRTANVARFRLVGGSSQTVIVFNTHLDVRSELARRKQSEVLRAAVREWQARFPDARVFVTGDFNSAPGQTAHRTLVGDATDALFNNSTATIHDDGSAPLASQTRSAADVGVADAWMTCERDAAACAPRMRHVVATFHGWLGTWVDTSLAALALGPLFTLHAMQLPLPTHVPMGLRELARAARDVCVSLAAPAFSVAESLPSSWAWAFAGARPRFHVDWILHSPRNTRPLLVAVGDLRESEFSSDHFPVIGLFEI